MSERERGPESTPAGQRAARARNTPGASDTGPTDAPAEGVLTLVCLKCGTEYYFDDADPPEGLTCEKCGGTVFRDFFTAERNDEASRDFDETTERDLDPDDAEGDANESDLMDLR